MKPNAMIGLLGVILGSMPGCETYIDFSVPSDAGAECVPNTTAPCYSGPAGTEGQGICRPGTMTCNASGTYGPCTGDTTPQPENCATAIDEDCNGLAEPCRGELLWSKNFGFGCVTDIAVDPDGFITIIGYFDGVVDFGGGPLTSAGSPDMFIARLDSEGNHIWSLRTCEGGTVTPAAVALDTMGNIAVTGYFTGAINFGGGNLVGSGYVDVFLAKLNPSGGHVWSKAFGDGEQQFARGVTLDDAGNVIVTGDFSGALDFGGGAMIASAGTTDMFLAELASDGSHVWSTHFGVTNVTGLRVIADPSSNAVVAGSFLGSIDFGAGPIFSAGLNDVFLARFDTNGGHVWSERFGDTEMQRARTVAMASGDVILGGDFAGSLYLGGDTFQSKGESDIFLARFNSEGSHLWSVTFGGPKYESPNDAGVDRNGNVSLTGEFSGEIDFGGGPLASVGSADGFLVKLDANGNHLWSRRSDGVGVALGLDGAGNTYVAECLDSIAVTKYSP